MLSVPRLLHHLVQFVCALLALLVDPMRCLLLSLRPSAALAAENLFLRKQLALYQKRHIQPRRATDATRHILHCNVTAHPTTTWTLQQLREAIPSDHSYRFFTHDRDSIFTAQFDQCIRHLGLKVLKTPPQCPEANALRERLIGTLRRECFDFLMPLTVKHLRQILHEWVRHYHSSRPHMVLGPGIPATAILAGAALRASPSASRTSLCCVPVDSGWLTSCIRAGREGGVTVAHDVSRARRVAESKQNAQQKPVGRKPRTRRRTNLWPVEGTPVVAGVQPPGFAPVTEEALEAIVHRLVTGLHPHKIVLFGSYVYGTPTADSDVDLLVIVETPTRPVDRYLRVSRLLRPRPFPLDLLVKTPEEIMQALEREDPFIREITSQGRVLYERSD